MKSVKFKIAFLISCISLLGAMPAKAQLVTTFAGNYTTGYTDDTGTNAAFNWPISIIFDKHMNMYVADADNNMVRKIITPNTVTSFAGNGTAGITDDTGTAARFNHPLGIAIDTAGNVYVTDSKNNTIRKITPAGRVTTFAGSGLVGNNDGPGATATFNYPNGLAVDDTGNVYVADSKNNMIRKITPVGYVSTLAGNLTAGSNNDTGIKASFNYPTGVAIDKSGNLFVADETNNMIRKISPAGIVVTIAGSGIAGSADDTGIAATFSEPYGITIDSSGSLYVAEIGNDIIRQITPTRQVMTLVGLPGIIGGIDGLKDVATFDNPTGVLLDGNGNLFVADWNNNVIRKVILGYTGIFTPRKSTTILPFPNPAQDVVTIPAKQNDEVIIYNVVGVEVYKTVVAGNNAVVSMKGFSTGLYTVQTIGKDGTKKTGKFIKQ
ncbi:MAG: T9SS type A sorting domain-containing protein [Flavipsychrobacter sp.]|nr:T9SS type A sorting domain-containing protein [Flavipsychrobacter sp.]